MLDGVCNFCVCVSERKRDRKIVQIERQRQIHTGRLRKVGMIARVHMHLVQVEVRDDFEGVGSHLLSCFEAVSLLLFLLCTLG